METFIKGETMIKLTEIFEEPVTNRVSVRNVFINPAHVVMVREDNRFNSLLREGKLADLTVDSRMTFSRISIHSGGAGGNYDIVVFGDSDGIYEKIKTSHRNLLKG